MQPPLQKAVGETPLSQSNCAVPSSLLWGWSSVGLWVLRWRRPRWVGVSCRTSDGMAAVFPDLRPPNRSSKSDTARQFLPPTMGMHGKSSVWLHMQRGHLHDVLKKHLIPMLVGGERVFDMWKDDNALWFHWSRLFEKWCWLLNFCLWKGNPTPRDSNISTIG